MQTLVESARIVDHLLEMRIDTRNTVDVSRIILAETYRLLHQSNPDPPQHQNEPPLVRYDDGPDNDASTIVFR